MPRILPKSITIDECDDLFEKEDETEERATSTSNGIDKSKLTIGVQVMARDSSANESKNHNSAKREAFDAVIVEPGISDNGMYYIIEHLLILPLLAPTCPLSFLVN